MSGLADLPEGTRQALSDAVKGAMIEMDGFDQISKKAEEEGKARESCDRDDDK